MVQPSIEGTGHGKPRMVFGSDGSDHYEVYVDSEGVLRVRASDGDKIFSFESIVEEVVEDTNLGVGNKTIKTDDVDSGKIWKITHIAVRFISATIDQILLQAYGLAGSLTLLHNLSPTSTQWYVWDGEIYLQVNDYLILYIYTCTAGDDASLRVAGVQMNAP